MKKQKISLKLKEPAVFFPPFPNKRKNEKLVRITLRVAPALKKAIEKEAKKEKLSFSAYCQEALLISIIEATR